VHVRLGDAEPRKEHLLVAREDAQLVPTLSAIDLDARDLTRPIVREPLGGAF